MSLVILIAAVARNGVIGRNNALPWHLPADLQHFKRHTLGRPVLMGRKTFEAIGKPLPNRRNIVLTRQPAWQAPGVERADSLADALHRIAHEPVVCVIGGTGLFAEALPVAGELLLTEIDADFEGDSVFPPWPRDAFDELSREVHRSDAGWRYDFVRYRAKASTSSSSASGA